VTPTVEHVVFIPGVLLIGVFIGYMMGARAVRDEVRRKQEARKR
jgi:hypothetical protein